MDGCFNVGVGGIWDEISAVLQVTLLLARPIGGHEAMISEHQVGRKVRVSLGPEASSCNHDLGVGLGRDAWECVLFMIPAKFHGARRDIIWEVELCADGDVGCIPPLFLLSAEAKT